MPFAYLLTRHRGIDLRHVGSGNVGAANVLRTSGLSFAILAMCLDAVKGALAVLVAQRLAGNSGLPVAAGLASVVGHIYPVWLRFRGGKGVATAAGAFAVLVPVAAGIASAVFILAVWITRYVSVGSMLGAVTLTVVAFVTETPAIVAIGSAVAAGIILHRHRGNVARLWDGTERRVGQRL